MFRRFKLGCFYGARALGGFAIARRITRRQLRVLGYHGGSMGDEVCFNPKLFMRRETFVQRLTWIEEKNYQVWSLDAAIDQLSNHLPLPHRAVVLTFDDGWKSTVSELLVETHSRRMPTTMYLATNYYDMPYPVINVALRYFVWKSGRRELTISEHEGLVAQHFVLRTRDDLECFSTVLRPWILAAGDAAVTRRLLDVARWLGLDSMTADDLERFSYVDHATAHALAEMSCAVEMHTHNHMFPVAHPDICLEQIAINQEAIIAAGLPPPRHFCYPSGNHGGIEKDLLAGSDVLSATTCDPGLLSSLDTPARARFVPRFIDGEDVAQIEFEAEMSGFTELLRRGLRWVRELCEALGPCRLIASR